MNQAILLESNADNIDFMIHGIFDKGIRSGGLDYHIACLYPHSDGHYGHIRYSGKQEA